MNINQRVRFLRKEILKLNQSDFAAGLGISQTGVSSIEKDGATITDRVVKSISLIYNISEDWLRYGTEPIKLQPKETSLEQCVREQGGTILDLQIIKAYFSIPPEIRQAALDYVINAFSHAPVSDPTAEDLEAAYKKMLSELPSKKRPSASNTTDDGSSSAMTSEG